MALFLVSEFLILSYKVLQTRKRSLFFFSLIFHCLSRQIKKKIIQTGFIKNETIIDNSIKLQWKKAIFLIQLDGILQNVYWFP